MREQPFNEQWILLLEALLTIQSFSTWMTLLYILNIDLITLIILEKYLNDAENLEYP